MDDDALLDALRTEAARFFDVASVASRDLPVPACPDWTVEELAGHLGGIHFWVAATVASGAPNPDLRPPEPPDDADAVAWARDGFEAMMAAFDATRPDSPCWNFRPGSPQIVSWWYRRQALEVAIHRFDIESAAGSPSAVDAPLAVEGIDEILCDMFPFLQRRGATSALHGTLHLHATDAEGEWWIDFDEPEPSASREHKKADTAVRGPASGLYLWLWNRQSPSEASLEVFGPQDVVTAWRSVTI